MSMNNTYYTVGISHATQIMHPICPGTIGMVIVIVGAASILILMYLSTFLLKAFGGLSVNITSLCACYGMYCYGEK